MNFNLLTDTFNAAIESNDTERAALLATILEAAIGTPDITSLLRLENPPAPGWWWQQQAA